MHVCQLNFDHDECLCHYFKIENSVFCILLWNDLLIFTSCFSSELDEPSVNSVINLKVKSFSLRLNKPEYELSRAQISQLSSHITTRDGNLAVTGQLGSISLTDQSPHGELYRERFMTIGHQALVFDVFK